MSSKNLPEKCRQYKHKIFSAPKNFVHAHKFPNRSELNIPENLFQEKKYNGLNINDAVGNLNVTRLID